VASVERIVAAACVNRISTSVPPHDVHAAFVDYACKQLIENPRKAGLFRRLAEQGQIERRYSFFKPSGDLSGQVLDADAVYKRGAFPSTATRMRLFEKQAPLLAFEAIERLLVEGERSEITHLIVTTCTGFAAPGIDLQIIEKFDLAANVERTIVGFMGCYAAMNGLKLARHLVRSEPDSKVLIVNLELCTLHLKETTDLDQILSFFLFADGCAASLISSDPVGIELDSFSAFLAPETRDLITWHLGDSGFDMHLSGHVPAAIRNALCSQASAILAGDPVDAIDLWAIHPGGRAVLDAVQRAMDLPDRSLSASREILLDYGNMSSATVMFVLKRLMETMESGQKGCAIAFGPGVIAETMRFHVAG
jgi:alpha-pyrone synthase